MEKKLAEFRHQLQNQHVNMMLSASRDYDKAILTLSTALLGFTFAL
jgi:hypothetical protein